MVVLLKENLAIRVDCILLVKKVHRKIIIETTGIGDLNMQLHPEIFGSNITINYDCTAMCDNEFNRIISLI